jgi:hypothetical protein
VAQVAALLAIKWLCAPGSELAIEQRWFLATALNDLLGIDAAQVNDTRLYRCLDRLLTHKGALERHLKQRYGELFAAQFDVLLYDLTSSRVEGAADKNSIMQRGYSRDHRPECKQLVIALIVNPDCFPLSYEIFDGNRDDVTTLEAIVRLVERKYGRARRVSVFDRGIVSHASRDELGLAEPLTSQTPPTPLCGTLAAAVPTGAPNRRAPAASRVRKENPREIFRTIHRKFTLKRSEKRSCLPLLRLSSTIIATLTRPHWWMPPRLTWICSPRAARCW